MTAGIIATLRIDKNDNVLVHSLWLLDSAINHQETRKKVIVADHYLVG